MNVIADALVRKFAATDIKVVHLENEMEGHFGYRLDFWFDGAIGLAEYHMVFRRALITDSAQDIERADKPGSGTHLVDWATDPSRIAEYILAIH